MPRKTLSDSERIKRINAQQKSYRERNPELVDLWRQRTYSNFLTQRGWQCTPPPGFPTLKQARQKRDILQQLDEPPADLSKFTLPNDFDIEPDEMP